MKDLENKNVDNNDSDFFGMNTKCIFTAPINYFRVLWACLWLSMDVYKYNLLFGKKKFRNWRNKTDLFLHIHLQFSTVFCLDYLLICDPRITNFVSHTRRR